MQLILWSMDIVDIHVYAAVYLYTAFMYFISRLKRFNSTSLKLLSADGMFIFMNTLVTLVTMNYEL